MACIFRKEWNNNTENISTKQIIISNISIYTCKSGFCSIGENRLHIPNLSGLPTTREIPEIVAGPVQQNRFRKWTHFALCKFSDWT